MPALLAASLPASLGLKTVKDTRPVRFPHSLPICPEGCCRAKNTEKATAWDFQTSATPGLWAMKILGFLSSEPESSTSRARWKLWPTGCLVASQILKATTAAG